MDQLVLTPIEPREPSLLPPVRRTTLEAPEGAGVKLTTDEMCRSKRTWEPSMTCPDCGRNLSPWIYWVNYDRERKVHLNLLPMHRKPRVKESA